MKRLISVLCVITLLFSAFSVVSFAGGDEFKPYEDSRFLNTAIIVSITVCCPLRVNSRAE